jgi:filamentous hemagglutinin family protein
LLLGVLFAASAAQVPTAIRPDGTLGTSVIKNGTVYDITGGTRPGNGPNLFHSFERFNVGTGDTAHFSGPAGIENILSRVTGGQQSLIDGRLRSTIPGANLYLLNPSGVLFGPNATLDISGSFHVSTADFLRLADGATFSAHLGEKSTLTVAPPAAFGFLGPTPAPITIQGSTLTVAEGKVLSVVGGDVQIVGGTLVTPSGRIQVTSVASPGEAMVSTSDLTPDLQVDTFARLGQLEVSQATLLDASGNGGGTVVIRSGRLLVNNASLFADTLSNVDGARIGMDIAVREDVVVTHGSFITADTMGAGAAGEIRLSAGSLRMEEDSILGSRASQEGKAGSIAVRATQVALTGGAQIDGSTSGRGQGGSVRITATDTLTLSGTRLDGTDSSGIFARAAGGDAGTGSAGSIDVQAPRVALTGGAQISSETRGPGQGGSVRITATDTLTLAGISPDGTVPTAIFANAEGKDTGNAGSIDVQAPRVALTGGAQIGSVTRGLGQGGPVRVTATDTLTLSETPSGIYASAEGRELGAGTAGSIDVQAPRMVLTGGAQIFSGTFGPGQGGPVRVTATDTLTLSGNNPDSTVASGIYASAEGKEAGAGTAGSIIVQAPRVVLTGGAQIGGGTFGLGQGNRVQVTATESLTLSGISPDGISPSGIFASARGTGARAGSAGAVVVEARIVQIADGALISSDTRGSGHGGTVRVTATESLTLFGTNPDATLSSGIVASAEGREADAGNAGSLVVEAPRVTLMAGARISSETRGPGQGGTITIKATDAVTVEGSASGIFARALSTGNAGQVLLSTPTLQVKEGAVIDSSTAADGQGGNIAVQARRIALSDGGTISTRSSGQGSAGNIVLQADEIFQSRHGAVSTEAEQADGGNIQLTAGSRVELRDSQLTATVKGGEGKGGNIAIDPQFIILQRSQVRADAFGGPGGNVRLEADVFLADPDSQVSASSTLGINGEVDIRAPVTNLSGVVAPLSPDFARATALLQDRCAARLREGTVSSFVVRGRPSLPATYDGPLPSRLYTPQRPRTTPAGADQSPVEPPATRVQGTLASALPIPPLVLALSCAR